MLFWLDVCVCVILLENAFHLQDAPYLLEAVARNFVNEDIQMRQATLTAAAQLFLKRPPECQLMLGSVLSSALADPSPSIRDRALLYYR